MRNDPDSKIPLQGASRREFLRRAGSIAAAVATASFIASAPPSLLTGCKSPDETTGPAPTTGAKVTITLADESALSAVGGFIRRAFGSNNAGQDVIVMRVADSGTDAFKTMSVICTHAGCAINSPSGGSAVCGCHGSRFGAAPSNFAAVLAGPASAPLQTYPTSFDGTTITITF